ncbi:hypothetical protein, conserved [Eimeria acervulina]|uniref:Uncharacterized protein n=1 Tax=Eimeria acervulina TaxID=5801 RepID=U6GT54_EIMAC|nr:hypothetical protein, conserved [Eimeria acervulina]CDI83355.1 hypothetical protein, conserved [Eimeria acervulina]
MQQHHHHQQQHQQQQQQLQQQRHGGPQAPFCPLGSARRGQQGRRGGRGPPRGGPHGGPHPQGAPFRGPGPRRGGPHRVPGWEGGVRIPMGALSDPWGALNGKYGGPCPLEGPTEEIMHALHAVVKRGELLQQMMMQKGGAPVCRERTTHTGAPQTTQPEGPPNAAENTPPQQQHQQQQHHQQQQQQSAEFVPLSSSDKDNKPREGAPQGGPPTDASEGGPFVKAQRRPLLLPPPRFDVDSAAGAENVDRQGPGFDPTGSDPRGSDPKKTDPPGSDPPGSDPNRSDPIVPPGAPVGPRRPFCLPAVTQGGPPGAPSDGGAILCLDEAGIQKRLKTQH